MHFILKSTITSSRSFKAKSLLELSNFKAQLNYSGIFKFASKKKRYIELKNSTITINSQQESPQRVQQKSRNYLQMKEKVSTLAWEEMSFDQLCALDSQVLNVLQIELKKKKFNISDEEFLKGSFTNGKQPLITYNDLNRNFKKIYSLLKSTNDYFQEFPQTQEIKKGYLHELYITDLKKDKELIQTISKFIKNIEKPDKLQNLAEPTFIKYLLSLKRDLMLQGIHFKTNNQKKEQHQKGEEIIESTQTPQIPQVRILQILNYEYQFWLDVRHNRAKNGSQHEFIIEERQIKNPNQSILLKDQYPYINIKYISRRKKLKDGEKNFCLKADLLIQINETMKRKVKVEWKGPSSKNMNTFCIASKVTQSSEQIAPKVNYMIIDYENIYDGNPTIRPVFHF